MTLETIKNVIEIIFLLAGSWVMKWGVGRYNHQRKNRIQERLFEKEWKMGLNEKIDCLIIGQRNTRELADIIYWEGNEKGEVTYVCPELCDYLSCDANQIKKYSWVGLIAEHDRQRIYKSYLQSIETVSFFREEFEFRGCDNKTFIKVSAYTIHNKDADGKLKNSVTRFKILS